MQERNKKNEKTSDHVHYLILRFYHCVWDHLLWEDPLDGTPNINWINPYILQ